MRNIGLKLSFMFTLLLVLVGCDSSEQVTEVNQAGAIQVVTSIFPMYEITKEIAGDRANVSLMVGSNEDAHHYEPSAQAVASVSEANVFIYSSDEMEFWAQSLLAVVENESLEVVELGADLNFTFDISGSQSDDKNPDEHDHRGLDPHFWLNPVAVNEQLDLIVEALIASDPEGAEIYRNNAEVLSKKLLELNRAYKKNFADATTHVFVVQHQAFGHLANEYHLDQVAVGGLSTEVEPSPKQLSEIVDLVNEQQVPVIYYQSGGNSVIAQTIAHETGTEIAVLYDLEGTPVNNEGESLSYMEAMYSNLEQLKRSIH